MITSILLIIAVMFGVNPIALWGLLITSLIDVVMWGDLCDTIKNRNYTKCRKDKQTEKQKTKLNGGVK